MNTTVDGRNPAPTGMYNDYPVNNGIFTYIYHNINWCRISSINSTNPSLFYLNGSKQLKTKKASEQRTLAETDSKHQKEFKLLSNTAQFALEMAPWPQVGPWVRIVFVLFFGALLKKGLKPSYFLILIVCPMEFYGQIQTFVERSIIF